jgi:4'-phosphopantetheinyl transferase
LRTVLATHPPSLTPGEVHVHARSLALGAATAGALAALLEVSERERAAHFHHERDLRRFVVAHGWLRLLLGSYLGVEPREVRFDVCHAGKPVLATSSRLHFNLGHSAELAVAGFALDHPVGVDVEQLRPVADAEGLAERYFTPGERAALASVPAAERDEAFFSLWTAKEAVVKATGEGLTRALDSIEVQVNGLEAPRLARIEGDDPTAWTLSRFQPAPGYTGALACRAPVRLVPLL